MRPGARTVALCGSVVVLAGALLLVGAVAGSPDDAEDGDQSSGPGPSVVTTVGPPQSALAVLQDAVERAPQDPQRWSTLGLAYVQQARLTADPSWYGKAEQALATSLGLEPEGNAAALTGQAALAAGRHQFADAERLAREALAINDFNPTTYGVLTDALTELGEYAQALDAIDRMLSLSPGVDSYSRLSYAYELRGDIGQARGALRQARDVARVPADEAFAEFFLGELAFDAGEREVALGHYEAALEADPDYDAAVAGRAKVRLALGRTEQALADYAEAVERLPLPATLAAYGAALESLGREAEAQEQYEIVRVLQQAFAADGSDVDDELALFEADHGDPATAIRLAKQAYDRRPDAIYVQDAYAWALHAAGRDAEALPIARASVRLGTADPLLLAHAGIIEAAAGEPERARALLERALQANPQFHPLIAPQAEQALAAL